MAAYSHLSCHDVVTKEDPVAQGEQPSVVCGKHGCVDDDGGGGDGLVNAEPNPNRSPSCFNFNDSEQRVDVDGPMMKKAKVHHPMKLSVCSKSYAATAVVAAHLSSDSRMPSPTDVRSHVGSGSQATAIQATAQIKTLPPTLKGIVDAANILRASKLSSLGDGAKSQSKDGQDGNAATGASTPLLLSFPTESVYMLGCCVKTASSRSIRKLLSRSDSQTSFSSSCSSEKGGNVNPVSCEDSVATHQEGSPPLIDSIHPQNASLEWMIKCNKRAIDDLAYGMAPFLFVLDAHHALNFCHFTKPKTYAIRPPSLALGSTKKSVSDLPTAETPTSTKGSSFCPLPVFGVNKSPTNMLHDAPLTPKPATGPISPPATPVSPNSQKLCAANFSESREAFLRLASKLWPGPVVFHVQVRMLGVDDASASNMMSHKLSSSSSSSIASLPSLSSAGDLDAVGKQLCSSTELAGVPVLPASALVPASQLLVGPGEGQESERYFVGMQCPSHPLPRKILNEIYCGHARPNSESTVSSLATDEPININGDYKISQQKGCKNGRARSSVAVVGCVVPGPNSPVVNKASSSSSLNQPSAATTAADVDKAMTPMMQPMTTNGGQEKQGRVFIVNGEDDRESFTVPTCQYGRLHPVSVVIDGDNRTIHLIRHCHGEAANKSTGATQKKSRFTKDSVYRALLKPASPSNSRQSMNLGRSLSQDSLSEKKGDSNSIDRVITAVLSRWKIQESTTSS